MALSSHLLGDIHPPTHHLPTHSLTHPHIHLPAPQEVLVLGRQQLTELRDAIQCLTDTNVAATEEQVSRGSAALAASPRFLRPAPRKPFLGF